MKALALILLIFASSTAKAEQPSTWLVSVEGVSLGPNEQVTGFAFETWGVTVKAVCHIPDGWTIRAGRSTTPSGVLEGKGSNGVSWFMDGSPPEFQNLVLIELNGPVQQHDMRSSDGSGVFPATFSGQANIATDNGERTEALTANNLRLVAADACPR